MIYIYKFRVCNLNTLKIKCKGRLFRITCGLVKGWLRLLEG